MCDSIRTHVLYFVPDENGETRNDRNARFGQPDGPLLVIPEAGQYLWDWYWNASQGLRRVIDGGAAPISSLEWQAWASITGELVRPSEYAILRAMDKTFCHETNNELKAYRDRKEAEEKAKGKQ